MSNKPHVSLLTILHSVERTVPKILLKRVEELYPAVMEKLVSGLRPEMNLIILFSVYFFAHRQ